MMFGSLFIRCKCGRMTDYGVSCVFCYDPELVESSKTEFPPEEQEQEQELED